MNIVISGSSSGIGRALAERLHARGHRVWGLARSAQTGVAWRTSRCDVADRSQVHRAARAVRRAWRRVDAIVTCAAVHGDIGPALAANPAHWAATVRTNLEGTYYPLRVFAPLLGRASRRAKIVCFSGGGATQARPNFSAYGAAKTAIVRLIETIAAEEPALDINAVAPGAIATRLTDEIIAAGARVAGKTEFAAAKKTRAAGAAPLANALDLVEWLLSPASDGISGRLLSAQWDPWRKLAKKKKTLRDSDRYTLRRKTR